MKTNAYCVIEMAVLNEPVILPEVTIVETVCPSKPLWPDASGNPQSVQDAGISPRISNDGELGIIKGEWTLSEQLGLAALGGMIYTYSEIMGVVKGEKWQSAVDPL